MGGRGQGSNPALLLWLWLLLLLLLLLLLWLLLFQRDTNIMHLRHPLCLDFLKLSFCFLHLSAKRPRKQVSRDKGQREAGMWGCRGGERKRERERKKERKRDIHTRIHVNTCGDTHFVL